jgi:hypothetical protein
MTILATTNVIIQAIYDPHSFLSQVDTQRINEEIAGITLANVKIIISGEDIDVFGRNLLFGNVSTSVEDTMDDESFLISLFPRSGQLSIYIKDTGHLFNIMNDDARASIVSAMMPHMSTFEYGPAFHQGVIAIKNLLNESPQRRLYENTSMEYYTMVIESVKRFSRYFVSFLQSFGEMSTN